MHKQLAARVLARAILRQPFQAASPALRRQIEFNYGVGSSGTDYSTVRRCNQQAVRYGATPHIWKYLPMPRAQRVNKRWRAEVDQLWCARRRPYRLMRCGHHAVCTDEPSQPLVRVTHITMREPVNGSRIVTISDRLSDSAGTASPPASVPLVCRGMQARRDVLHEQPQPLVRGLPGPIASRQVTPWCLDPQLPQNPVEHLPVIAPPPPPTRHRQQRLNPRPRPIRQLTPTNHNQEAAGRPAQRRTR